MLRRLSQVPIGIYAMIFVGLSVADYIWGGQDFAERRLPVRMVVFAIFMAILWLVRRRNQTFR